MVLIRNNVQKESTYGWYPSQVNVYDNPRAKKGYGKSIYCYVLACGTCRSSLAYVVTPACIVV